MTAQKTVTVAAPTRPAGADSLHTLDGLLERRNDCMSALTCLYLAVDKRIADDVNEKVKAYIRELEAEKQPIVRINDGL